MFWQVFSLGTDSSLRDLLARILTFVIRPQYLQSACSDPGECLARPLAKSSQLTRTQAQVWKQALFYSAVNIITTRCA